ncbi:MAG: hypothetical protein AAF603_11790 [Pseudomonadota bacterium]
MLVNRLPFVLGALLGLSISFMAPSFAQSAMPTHKVATEAWPHMSQDQRRLVDLLARDLYQNGTSPAQKQRIGGSTNSRFDQLPEWKKAPFRGTALRQLGHDVQSMKKGSV